MLKKLKKHNITIIVSTPYMDEASLCDELMVLNKGEILLNGTPQNLLSSYPYSIFKVGNSNGATSFKSPPRLPTDVLLMYPSAGMMQVVVKNKLITQEQVFASIKPVMPDIDIVEVTKPSIEDLFILLISEKESLIRREQ